MYESTTAGTLIRDPKLLQIGQYGGHTAFNKRRKAQQAAAS